MESGVAIWKYGSHKEHVNSLTCSVRPYAYTLEVDGVDATIRGRYPQEGYLINREVDELVRVTSGDGFVVVRRDDAVWLSVGDALSVKRGTPIAWLGNMVLDIVCTPAFSAEQYGIIEEKADVLRQQGVDTLVQLYHILLDESADGYDELVSYLRNKDMNDDEVRELFVRYAIIKEGEEL